MASVEHGPFKRRGTSTTDITPIGTLASSTGLPQESTTTSFIVNSVGTISGHDTLSGSSALKSNYVSALGGGSSFVSYNSFGTIFASGGGSSSNQQPNSVVTDTAGTSLPIPSGGGGGSSLTQYYKMVGYYTTGAVYESFVVTGSPSPPTTTNPSTGHTLYNTFVSSFWEI
jgi:hypothetical protein